MVEFVLFFCNCCWSTSWNSRSKFYFNFFFNHKNNKKIVKHKKKKKHDKIITLAKSKLNSIETLVSHALIDMEMSYEDFDKILKEKKNMRR